MQKPCDVCEGTGRLVLDGERTMICNNGCTQGQLEVVANDLDGRAAAFLPLGMTGFLSVLKDQLVLEDERGVCVINLLPDDVVLL